MKRCDICFVREDEGHKVWCPIVCTGPKGAGRLQLEEWSSTHNRKERHYFLQDGRAHGYQVDGAYLVGLNPEIVTREQEQAILEILRPVWE